MIANQYLPISIFLLFGIFLGIVLVTIGRVLGRRNPDEQKNSPYECGFEAFESARTRFDIRYYLIAIIFILFDLEVAFLFPWAVIFKALGLYGLGIMAVFLLILIVGFIYVWKKGALEWE